MTESTSPRGPQRRHQIKSTTVRSPSKRAATIALQNEVWRPKTAIVLGFMGQCAMKSRHEQPGMHAGSTQLHAGGCTLRLTHTFTARATSYAGGTVASRFGAFTRAARSCGRAVHPRGPDFDGVFGEA